MHVVAAIFSDDRAEAARTGGAGAVLIYQRYKMITTTWPRI